MVLVGVELAESLYHLTLFISFTNSILWGTPLNFLHTSIAMSLSTSVEVAAMAAQIFS